MKPVVLGIAGGTASGKSTVARGLADALGDDCVLIVHDRYYHSLPEHLRSDPIRHNFDHPSALDTPRLVRDLAALRAGERVSIPNYDFPHHRRLEGQEQVEPRRFVVVEGILVLADPTLRDAFDHTVYVDTPDDLRLMRRIRRDVAFRGRTVEQILEQYERTVRPMHEKYVRPSLAHAQLVIDGAMEVEGNVMRILRRLGL